LEDSTADVVEVELCLVMVVSVVGLRMDEPSVVGEAEGLEAVVAVLGEADDGVVEDAFVEDAGEVAVLPVPASGSVSELCRGGNERVELAGRVLDNTELGELLGDEVLEACPELGVPEHDLSVDGESVEVVDCSLNPVVGVVGVVLSRVEGLP
jgi:hypothetical protein